MVGRIYHSSLVYDKVYYVFDILYNNELTWIEWILLDNNILYCMHVDIFIDGWLKKRIGDFVNDCGYVGCS